MKLSRDQIHVTPAQLLISGSQKCVSVEGGSSPLLVTQSHQDESEGRVQVCEMLYGTRRCMAFRFEVEDKAIFPFVDDKDIKFKELSSKQEVTLDETFLFQWGERNPNDWRSLKSVAKPSMFLFAEDNENKVTIKPIQMPHFQIKIKGETQTSDREVFQPKKHENMKTPYERSAKTAKKGKERRLRPKLMKSYSKFF